MLEGISHVTAALSGGADSMSLLHFLVKNRERLGITVDAAHLDHNIRGQEAKRDEEFVKRECEKLGVRLHLRSLDIPALAKERKIGLEECGRQERYRFFEELRETIPASVTATAHTASDNAETVLLNITRGCGIDGLCGIPPVRSGIIRPLIGCTRGDVEAYCAEHGVPFITDSTNLSDEYSRNRVRLNVMPQLELINPSAQRAINRLSMLARSDAAVIKAAAGREAARCAKDGGLDVKTLMSCEEHIIPRVILSYLSGMTETTPEKRHIDLIVEAARAGHGAVEIKKGEYVAVSGDIIKYINTPTDLSANKSIKSSVNTEIPFKAGQGFDFNGKHYEISEKKSLNSADNNKINKKLLINCLSCGIISCDTIFRTRRSGDVFTQAGRGCTKTVKKLFSELKLSPQEREARLVAANGSTVLWIEGVGVSQQAAVCEDGPFYEIKAGC